MNKNEQINQKIDELIALAKSEGDGPTQILLLALRGSKMTGQDTLLATRVQDVLKNEIMPATLNNIELQKISRN